MRDVCFYDGHCGFCRRSTAILRRLDWLGRLEFRDMTTTPDLPVPLEAAMTGMPMRTAHGRVLVGFPAIRRALRRTPLGAPFALLLYVPGISRLASRCYNFIATHRPRDTCSAPGQPHTPS